MVWSKLHPKFAELPCKHLAHPWTDNCFSAAANTCLDSFIGSAGFFGVLFTCQYLAAFVKKKNKAQFKDFLRIHFWSTIFGVCVSTGSLVSHCLLRRLIGRYYLPTVIFIPTFIGGFSIYFAPPKIRQLFTNTFANSCLEIWLRLLEKSKILNWNLNVQTIAFMVLSSFLSSLFGWTNFDSNCFWFFIPPKVKKGESDKKTGICFHEGNCLNHIFNLLVMYSATGFAVQFLKLVFVNYKNPKSILYSLARARTFKLSAFLGGYVVMYQGIRCFLYQKQKKYSFIHDTVAGFLAGITYRFQPTIPIFNSAIITTFQILTELGCKKKLIPDLPYAETLFALFCGFLFHYRILGKESPQFLIYTMSSVTKGLSDKVAYRYKNILKNLDEKLNVYS